MNRGRGKGRKVGKGSSSEIKNVELDEIEAVCGECKMDVTKDGLECEVCERWYHCECQGVSEEVYKVLDQDCIHWYCRGCDKRMAKLVKTVARLEERQEKLEVELADTKNEVKQVKDEVRKLDSVKEEVRRLDSKVNEMANSQVSGSVGMRRDDVLEEIEIERRKMNLVVNGLREGSQDEEEIREVFTKLAGIRGVRSIVRIERIGRRAVNKIRPVRVVLNNMDGRLEILKQAPGLKSWEEYKKLFISPDLTRKQLEREKTLRLKLKEIREGGERNAKISKGRVVKKLEDGAEVVLFTLPLIQM